MLPYKPATSSVRSIGEGYGTLLHRAAATGVPLGSLMRLLVRLALTLRAEGHQETKGKAAVRPRMKGDPNAHARNSFHLPPVRAAKPLVLGTGSSVPRSVCHVIHPYFNLDTSLRNRKLSSERRNQHRRRFNGIRYLFSPRSILRFCVVVQPDLEGVAIVLFTNGGKQVREVRPF